MKNVFTGLIPQPCRINVTAGQFKLSRNISVNISAGLEKIETHLKKILDLAGVETGVENSEIVLRFNSSLTELGEEGYILEINEGGILIESATVRGVFHGIQTLHQLVLMSQHAAMPCMRIEDKPRFRWRGMMLDESRHFFGKEFVKKFLDVMALYKMNSFHWHLTDDQGWRIEIKKYPKLTSIGSIRAESPVAGDRHSGDGRPYGGFYTQDDIREIVKYADERHINIVPEIEMPGHAAAAIASYPEFGNRDIVNYKTGVRTSWGVHYDTYSPTFGTFKFIEDVIDEVTALFPGKYFHIGGDEVPKEQWMNSPMAQQVMAENGLKNENELQSYFIRRVDAILKKRGRFLIGWDEIQEGGLSPNAIMMVYRDQKWAKLALENGNSIIMAPWSHTYFDHYQSSPDCEPEAIGGLTLLEKVYSFEPIPVGTSRNQKELVLGAQGQLWSEYLFDGNKVEFMAFPRMLALSEVLWSSADKDYNGFLSRLKDSLKILDAKNVQYRNPF